MPTTVLILDTITPCPVALLRSTDARIGHPRIHRDRRLVKIRPGVYASRDEFIPLAPSDRYLTRVHALAATRPDVVLAGPSACAVRGLPVLGRPTLLHSFDPLRSTSTRVGDVVVHTSDDPRCIDRFGGVRVTGIADTVLDSVRSLGPAAGVALVDAALRRHGPGLLRQLDGMLDAQVSSRGRAKARVVLSLADALSESVGESVSRVAIGWLGFEPPELQTRFPHSAGVDRVDFSWRSVRAIGEFDGYAKYLDDPSATAARRVMDEKMRENRLRRVCRAFDRWDWAELMAVRPLEQRLIALGVPRSSPRRTALLAGIRPAAF